MSAGYSFVEYAPEFKGRVLALQTHLWSPDLALNGKYFEWKHERNPYFSAPMAILAVRGDDVVGMRTLMGSCWEVGRGTLPVVLPYADDFVIAPAHRGSGLARSIMVSLVERARAIGAPYLVNLSAGSVTALVSLAAGWRSAGPMLPVARYRSDVSLDRVVRRLGRLCRFSATRTNSAPFTSLDRKIDRQPGGDAVVVSRTPRPGAMAQLVERCGYDGRIRHLRDATFLAWRFQNPLHDYRFLFLDGGQLAGYLVLQSVVSGPHSRVQVVDWEATDPRGLELLLRFAISEGKFAEIFAWGAAQPAAAADVLRRCRFQPADIEIRRRGSPPVLVRATAASVSEEWRLGEHRVLDPGSWDMRLLYSMHG